MNLKILGSVLCATAVIAAEPLATVSDNVSTRY